MFQTRRHRTKIGGLLVMAEVVFHSVVRGIREKNNNAFIALGVSLMQVVTFVLVFYLMFTLIGARSAGLRGDFLLYILSGIFLFMIQNKTITAVSSAGGLNSSMMQHAPMNSLIAIASAAIGALYLQVLTLLIILFGYHALMKPVYIDDPIGALGMILLAWFSGISIGLLFLVLKPWFPNISGILRTIYQRANMIASGKMFVANTLPAYMLKMFDWNPLFHIIDQSRGYVFLNYTPRYTSWEYAFWLSTVFVMIGLMGEFFTRHRQSLSWTAR